MRYINAGLRQRIAGGDSHRRGDLLSLFYCYVSPAYLVKNSGQRAGQYQDQKYFRPSDSRLFRYRWDVLQLSGAGIDFSRRRHRTELRCSALHRHHGGPAAERAGTFFPLAGGYRRFFRHSVYALRQFNRQRFSVRWRPSAVRDGSRRRVRPACRSLHRHLQHSDPFSQWH